LDSTPVHVRGEDLREVWWRGRQWAVTAGGIERLDGTYIIEANRLDERHYANKDWPDWPQHIAEEAWADVDEFATAWMVAVLLHGKAGKLYPKAIRESFSNLRRTTDIAELRRGIEAYAAKQAEVVVERRRLVELMRQHLLPGHEATLAEFEAETTEIEISLAAAMNSLQPWLG
jgi:hypothetical protein